MSTRRSFLKKSLLGASALSISPSLIALSKKDKLNFADQEDIQFLYKGNKKYLNTASLGLASNRIVDAICSSLTDLEEKGRDGRWLFKEVHEKLANWLNTTPDQLALTRNCTEGMNIAAKSLQLQKGDHVLITKHEHVGGAAPWISLKKENAIDLSSIELNLSGKNNLERFKEAINERTKVVSFSHVLCTTGMVLPAKEIIQFCRSIGIYTVVDGAQAAGNIQIDLEDLDPDFYISSGHKWLFGPKGSGFIFINNKIIDKIIPPFVGAYTDSKFDLNASLLEYRSTANREEYGTRNASLVHGFGAAIDVIQELDVKSTREHGVSLIDHFINGLGELPQIEHLSATAKEHRSCIHTFRFKNLNNQKVVTDLDKEHNFYLRYIYENDLDAIRLSAAIYTKKEDVDELVSVLKSLINED